MTPANALAATLRALAIAGCAVCWAAAEAPKDSLPPAPGALRALPKADASLAGRSIDEVATAIAPLRGEAPPATQPPPSEVVVEARRRVAAGQIDDAVKLLAERLRQDAGDLQVWRELARTLDAAGRRDLASEAWGRILAAVPLDPEALAGGGVDAAAARQPLVAVERLLRLRQMTRVGEAPRPEPREAIGQLVALGLSLRELGSLRAAAESLNEAWRESRDWKGPDAAAIRRQGADLLRIAGECALGAGDAAAAAESFRAALAEAGVEDRVALPRLTWSLLACGEGDAARAVVQQSMSEPAAHGRAGLAASWAALPENLRPAPPTDADIVVIRAILPAGSESDARRLLREGSDRTHFGPALAFIAERVSASRALASACDRVTEDPWTAGEVAAAVRSTAMTPSFVRSSLAARDDAAGRLLHAQFELLGGDAQAAMRRAGVRDESGAVAAALRTAEALAAGALEDGATVRRVAGGAVEDARLAAALADAFVALGERTEADAWAERAIALDAEAPEAWMARARANLMAPTDAERADGPQARLGEARLAAERAWEAGPNRSDAARALLQLVAAEAPQRAEIVELLRAAPRADAALRELDRAEALRRVQLGQGEPALDTLRTLLVEDPLDAEVARALVLASSAAGSLDEAERFLESLAARRPAAGAVLEARVTALARRGRLDEGVAALRAASQAEPESVARRLAWARALSLAARNDEAWAAFEGLGGGQVSPRLRLERAELALRAGREDAAEAALREIVSARGLTGAQRLSALALALRLPGGTEARRQLAADIGRAALEAPEAGPLALAAAMLSGDEASAASLAARHARAWPVPPSLEAAQHLLDAGLPARAAMFLRSIATRPEPRERAALARAELATLASAGDAPSALAALRRAHEDLGTPVLLEQPEAGETEDIHELAGMFLLAGRDPGAIELFAQAVARRPDMGEALNNLAWLRILDGRLDAETGDLVRRALEAGPDEPSTLDTAGWWSYRSGAPIEEALERLQRAVRAPDPGVEPLDHLGDALWAAGRRDEAATTWRLVAERGRGSGSRAAAIQAFDRMQVRRAGLRAWNGASFYDARDGAAIARAQAKLQAIAEGREPPIAPRPPATPAPAPASVP